MDYFVPVREDGLLAMDCALGSASVWVKDKRKTVSSLSGSVRVTQAHQRHAGEYTCSQGSSSVNYFVIIQGRNVYEWFDVQIRTPCRADE